MKLVFRIRIYKIKQLRGHPIYFVWLIILKIKSNRKKFGNMSCRIFYNAYFIFKYSTLPIILNLAHTTSIISSHINLSSVSRKIITFRYQIIFKILTEYASSCKIRSISNFLNFSKHCRKSWR